MTAKSPKLSMHTGRVVGAVAIALVLCALGDEASAACWPTGSGQGCSSGPPPAPPKPTPEPRPTPRPPY
jgi:hypothetical protein